MSVLDPAMEAITRIQGGEAFFVSEAINLCSTLHKSFAASDQEIRSANRFDGPAISIPVLELRNPISLQLDILLKQMESRNLGKAIKDVELVCLALDPRYKSLCRSVCVNGGETLQDAAQEAIELAASNVQGSARVAIDSAGFDGDSAPQKPPTRLEKLRQQEIRTISEQVPQPDPDGTMGRRRALLKEYSDFKRNQSLGTVKLTFSSFGDRKELSLWIRGERR